MAVANVAAVVPRYYADPERIAQILEALGKSEAAKYLRQKLPVGTRSRSGDLGEILALEWVGEFTGFTTSIFKLRWKDHRDLAMRGDDILAVCGDSVLGIRFLKGEAKSRTTLTKTTVEKARAALLSGNGRPAPHALAFLSDRLSESGETEMSDLIVNYQLKKGIRIAQLSHLMFMFTGNDPQELLTEDLESYRGRVHQYVVGLRVSAHQAFIKQVFDKVT